MNFKYTATIVTILIIFALARGFVVHFEDDAFRITDGDCGGKFFDPGVVRHEVSRKVELVISNW